MIIIRPIRNEDLDSFEQIAQATGLGMTSIPKAREALKPLIEQSVQSFAKGIKEPKNESYLFVLEDLETNEVGGVCGVYSKTGVTEPVYFYRLETRPAPQSKLPSPNHFVLLNPIHSQNGPSELYSLYLMPQFRKEGLGKLLAFSRFLFIASFPERFDTTIYAELRGYIDPHKESPFWNGLGRFFLHMSFAELNTHLNGRRNYFPEGLPEFPIYKMLLAPQTQKVIQKTHKNTKNALRMLIEEGFSVSDRINPIDAGPIVEAPIASIRTIRESCIACIKKVSEKPLSAKICLISNDSLDFRCCYGKVKVFSDGQISIEQDVVNALMLAPGDHVRYTFVN